MALNLTPPPSDPRGLDLEKPSCKPFGRKNYLMMGACVLLVVVGFLLMSGGGSSTQEGFNPEIFSTRRIVVGPALAFLGFLLMAFAIIWSPETHKSENKDNNTES